MKKVWKCPACFARYADFDDATDCCEPFFEFECEVCKEDQDTDGECENCKLLAHYAELAKTEKIEL